MEMWGLGDQHQSCVGRQEQVTAQVTVQGLCAE